MWARKGGNIGIQDHPRVEVEKKEWRKDERTRKGGRSEWCGRRIEREKVKRSRGRGRYTHTHPSIHTHNPPSLLFSLILFICRRTQPILSTD